MAFDWERLLRQYRIPYEERGTSGWIKLTCPFCADDTGSNFGISLDTGGWSCWRNSTHNSKSHKPHARRVLIQALLRCDDDTAHTLAWGSSGSVQVPAVEELHDRLRVKLGGVSRVASPKQLILPREFKPVGEGQFSGRFEDYLAERGYANNRLEVLLDFYDLHYAVRGDYAHRVIIPVRDSRGHLLTWTARTVSQREELRYKALAKEASVVHPQDALLGAQFLGKASNPKVLVVCEGPFDAMWVTVLGHMLGVYGTCLFGLNLSSAQAAQLMGLRQVFPRQVLLLDSAARFQTFRLAHGGAGLEKLYLPAQYKDPAATPPQGIVDICLRLTTT